MILSEDNLHRRLNSENTSKFMQKIKQKTTSKWYDIVRRKLAQKTQQWKYK